MQPEPNEPEYPKPAIFSPQAVWGFSTFFSPLAGGILAYSALRKAGKSAAAWHLLGMGIGLLVAYLFLRYGLHRLFFTLHQQDSWPGLKNLVSIALYIPQPVMFGIVGYYLKRAMETALPDAASYPRQSVIVPLVICLVVVGIPIVLLIAFLLTIGRMGP